MIGVFVLGFTYVEKRNEADIVTLNLRNELLIGDFRTAHQVLQNSIHSTANSAQIFNSSNELIISANGIKPSNNIFKSNSSYILFN